MRNIILIGFMGAGKTSIAKMLTAQLQYNYVDMDTKIIEKSGRSSDTEIFDKDGESTFRELEILVAKELQDFNNSIVSTGGGVVMNKIIIDFLKKNGTVVFLKNSFDTAKNRIEKNRIPPLFRDIDKAKKLYELRLPLYTKYADIIVETDNKTLIEVTDEIIAKIRSMNETNPTLCVVIGDPVAHSLSPQIHNAGYQELGLNFHFVAKHIKATDLEDFIQKVEIDNIRGVSVTLPHKIEIMKYVDELDESAKKIGAINTIVNDNGKLKGYNTDWLGIVRPIEQRIKLDGKTVAIIGASGAARAASYGVTSKGAALQIYNRTLKKAETLAEEFGGEAFSLDALEKIKNADIIINTTPIGMEPHTNDSPLPKEYITKNHIVFDVVYTPHETKLLQDAKNQGAKIIHGTEMFVEQAAAQFKLYTGHDAPIDAMKKALT